MARRRSSLDPAFTQVVPALRLYVKAPSLPLRCDRSYSCLSVLAIICSDRIPLGVHPRNLASVSLSPAQARATFLDSAFYPSYLVNAPSAWLRRHSLFKSTPHNLPHYPPTASSAPPRLNVLIAAPFISLLPPPRRRPPSSYHLVALSPPTSLSRPRLLPRCTVSHPHPFKR